jgi:glycine dehydrogenase
MPIDSPDSFEQRHIGHDAQQQAEMLRIIGVRSLDALIDAALPRSIRLEKPLQLPPAEAEHEYLDRLRTLAAKNQRFKSFIGMGYYGTITPSVILRNLFENPSWYTPYTPYQAEIAQGRLESLLNFQTMVRDLTAMDIATASLLDEATAAAEAMTLLHRVQARQPSGARNTFWVSERSYPQILEVLKGRAEPLGIHIVIGNPDSPRIGDDVFGAFLQSPDDHGAVLDLRSFIARAHQQNVLVAVGTDLLALTLVIPPGEMGADVVVGSAQRFGVPMGYGGPHAAFLATRETFVRQAPGRIIGVSVDFHGDVAFRMALQTREQHIRREKATSNICTAQALLANIAAMYGVYHGPAGLTSIAGRVHALAAALERSVTGLGYAQQNPVYFDTLRIQIPEGSSATTVSVRAIAERAGVNFRYFDNRHIGISLDETTSERDLTVIAHVLAEAAGKPAPEITHKRKQHDLPRDVARKTPFMTHPVFSAHRSETKMMRYLKRLEQKDVGLDRSMIPLGSCTMKLNAASEMIPVTWPEFSAVHPFAPVAQVQGYAEIIGELEQALAEITGFAAVSLQPNSGAQGELAGLMAIRAYHRSRGEAERDVVLIPSSAHGTNPASAVMAGLKVVVVATDANGNVDIGDLKAKAEQHRDRLGALMVTYPSTHGVFEEAIQDICGLIHQFGGQVYMDGANMNAQVGLTSPAAIGADVCHLNLHKTFAIPHGGGGPGMGPIGVAAHLAPFLPGHPVVRVGGPQAIPAVSAAPWGSASILLISYGYIRMLGAEGMTNATRHAILNANYIKRRLEPHYDVLYTRPNGTVAHEMIFDLRRFKASGVDELDVAKRLMDYGFHAPTVSFPVAGTLMIEPTESESQEELDRFCDAMIAIRQEIQAVVDGRADPKDNVLKNAPHTAAAIASDQWKHPYSREQAVFPLPFVKANKFWPPVGRIDNAYGDRNLICTCPDTAEYIEDLVK